MSLNFAQKIVSDRNEFLKHLESDLKTTDSLISSSNKSLEELKSTAENVQTLGSKVEHTSMIPLGKNIYLNGTIKHTGEYFVDHLASPDSYSTLETLESTLNLLKKRIKTESDLLENANTSKAQIEERIKLLMGNEKENPENLPQEIVSDKGVAVRVGEFYEILEFENQNI